MRISIRQITLLVFVLCWMGMSGFLAAAPRLTYTLSMDEPQTHFFDVEMGVTGLKQEYIDFKMAAWTPGSYLIREYARNVEAFQAMSGNQPLRAEKISKNTWRVYSKGANNVSVRYKVYAYEFSVRTSFLDQSHGYINGASVFMFIDKQQQLSSTLTVKPYKGWNKISTGLSPINTPNQFTFQVPNFDILVDSPIEIGTHEIFTFNAAGIPHEVAMYGQPEYNQEILKRDMTRVIEATAAVIGEHPCKDYTFIIHHTPAGGGGLEHLNSTTLQTTRNVYQSDRSYIGLLSLVAHEYFHLWNVKRIRPITLGPFDYENENYTTLLWVSEGITSYYDDYLIRRAGIYTPEQYLDVFSGAIGTVENQPGTRIQSPAESSFDAWIKGYRPNENSVNSTISYYSIGHVLGGMLDLEIMGSTKAQRSLDDVMRLLYSEYYKKQNRGFTEAEFQKAVETVAGKSMESFFRDHVYSTKPLDYNRYFGFAGLQLVNRNEGRNDPYLGASTSTSSGRMMVTTVLRGSPAWNDGINVNDEIVSVNGERVGSDLNSVLANRNVGDKLVVTVSRSGRLQDIPVTLTRNPAANVRIEKLPNPTAEQTAVYRRWMRL
jgi:predicted metalloprotease with PDZ domain